MWKLTANKETAPGSWHWCADAGTPAVGNDVCARKSITYQYRYSVGSRNKVMISVPSAINPRKAQHDRTVAMTGSQA